MQIKSVLPQYNQFIGTIRGENTTKIHVIADGLGHPVQIQLTGGNVQDYSVAVDILAHMDISNSTILSDKAYGTKEILDYIQQQDGDDAIPLKSNTRNPWKYDWFLYKERHLIECFFLKLKQFRRIATRHDK